MCFNVFAVHIFYWLSVQINPCCNDKNTSTTNNGIFISPLHVLMGSVINESRVQNDETLCVFRANDINAELKNKTHRLYSHSAKSIPLFINSIF